MLNRGSETVGIDLGTTYSALAYVDTEGIPRLLCNAQGRSVIPSVVQFREDGCVVGEPDASDADLDVENLARFIKAHIGSEWRKLYRGQMHTSESLSAIVLRALKDEAEPRIGPVRQAVMTVPAYFTEKRRRATGHAGEIAGLKIMATLNEPMAATLAFCHHARAEEQTVLVYDLGGGTFDITIVRITPREIVELASNGILDVGGRNWDDALIDLVADDIRQKHGEDVRNDPRVREQVRQSCERVKRRLGRTHKATIAVNAFGREHTMIVTRHQFEERTASLVQSTVLTAELALEDAEMAWSDLSRVILVGGASQMPAVREMLKSITDVPVDTSINPATAVALGAAIYAHQLDIGSPILTVTQPAPEELSEDEQLPEGDDTPRSRDNPETSTAAIHIHRNEEGGESAGDAAGAAGTAGLFRGAPGNRGPSPREVDLTSKPPVGAEQPSVFEGIPAAIRFVTAHGVGIRVVSSDGPANSVLIPRNTSVPASASHVYVTAEPTHQETFVRVEITQGDTADAGLAESLGTGRIEGFPAGLPAGQQVQISMTFDPWGRLHVSAVHLGSGKQMRLTLDIPGGLSCEEVRQQRDQLQKIPHLRVVHSPESCFGDPDDDDLSDVVDALLK